MKDKKSKYKQAHTDNTKLGMGDYYGTGLTAKIGKMRDGGVGFIDLTKKQMHTPPKNLA
jgi:hypothetical protein